MMPVSRRGLVAGAAIAAAAAATLRSPVLAHEGQPVLLYDAGLAASARFAAHARRLGGAAQPMDGDRVRQVQALVRTRPAAFFGVSRQADAVIVSEVAQEAGYRRISLIQHRVAGDMVPICVPDATALATLARLAGGRWPEAFAELAIGGIERCEPLSYASAAEPAFSWVLTLR